MNKLQPEWQEEVYAEKIDVGLWRQILRLARPYRRYIGWAIVSTVALAVGDAAFPYMTKIALDRFVIPQNTQGLGWFAAAYAGLVVFQSFNIYLFISMAGKVESGLTYTIRNEGFVHLHRLSFSFYDKRATGWLLARLTSDANRLGEIVSWSLIDLLWELRPCCCMLWRCSSSTGAWPCSPWRSYLPWRWPASTSNGRSSVPTGKCAA